MDHSVKLIHFILPLFTRGSPTEIKNLFFRRVLASMGNLRIVHVFGYASHKKHAYY